MLGVLSSLGLAIWLGHHSRWSDVAFNTAAAKAAEKAASENLAERRRIAAQEQLTESLKPKPAERFGRPEIATKPPFPKVLLEGEQFDFGTARAGESKRHFVCIKNVGEAPLIVARAPVCHARWQWELKVGETFDYELEWTPMEPGRWFAQTGTLWTNDPQRPEIHIRAFGRVVGPLPRVAIEERIFDFGTALVGQSMRHTFHIKNVGDAPLEIHPAPVCGHAIPPCGINWRRIILVGETFDLELKWTPREVARNFAISVRLITNDPERPELGVKVHGRITDPNQPAFDWSDFPIVP